MQCIRMFLIAVANNPWYRANYYSFLTTLFWRLRSPYLNFFQWGQIVYGVGFFLQSEKAWIQISQLSLAISKNLAMPNFFWFHYHLILVWNRKVNKLRAFSHFDLIVKSSELCQSKFVPSSTFYIDVITKWQFGWMV